LEQRLPRADFGGTALQNPLLEQKLDEKMQAFVSL
jgi:hypothetical protein